MIMAPLVRGRKGDQGRTGQAGDARLCAGAYRWRTRPSGRRVGRKYSWITQKPHHDVVIDRLLVKPGMRSGGASVATQWKPARVLCSAWLNGEEHLFSARMACPIAASDAFSGTRSFSFNSVYGACPNVNGLGTNMISIRQNHVQIGQLSSLTDGRTCPSDQAILQRMVICRLCSLQLVYLRRFEKFRQKSQEPPSLRRWTKKRLRAWALRGVLGFLKQNREESTSESYAEWMLSYMSRDERSVLSGGNGCVREQLA